MAMYITWLELGDAIRESWASVCVSVCESSLLKMVTGGWSHVLRKILEEELRGAEGLETAGAPCHMQSSEDSRLVVGEIAVTMSGGDGHAAAFHGKAPAA